MKSLRFSDKTAPFAILFISILCYGLLIPWTGFYWDDWPFARIARFLGPGNFIPAFHGFRPFLGPIFAVTTALVPPHPALWQTFALVIHFLAGLAAWWSLGHIWPNHRRQVLIAALLLLAFPGYSQHWVALTHVNQEWIPFIFYLLSFGFTARLVRHPEDSRRDTAYGLLLMVAGLFPTEYFIGLEPLRFLFIFVIVAEQVGGFKARLVRSLKYWWPYLLIWLLNAAWLAYYYRSGDYVSYDLALTNSALTAGRLVPAMLEAFWKAGLYAWFQILILVGRSITAPSTLVSLVLILVAFAALAFYLTRLDSTRGPDGWARQAIAIGAIGILLGRVPSLAAGLPLTLQSSYDRFMISLMLGACLFAAGLLESIRQERLRPYAAALLIGLAVGQQFFNANIFRRDWARQQEIYWQFAWRIPALKPYTLLLTDQMPLDYETDLSMTAPLNWIYGSDFEGEGLPYLLLYTEKRLGGVTLPALERGRLITVPYRTETYHGTTSQALVIYVPPDGCLRVLDPAFGDDEIYKGRKPRVLTDAIPLSDPSRIEADAPDLSLPRPPFGAEPVHAWCYFYEKAELARQGGDWKAIPQLAEEAASRGYAPRDALEWLPFIEGAIYSGSLGDAKALSRTAYASDPRIRKALCVVWEQFSRDTGLKQAAAEPLSEFGCRQ